MKKLNTKSDVYYINKAVIFKPLNLMKVHLIDDNCNEFTVTAKGNYIHPHSYISPSEITIIDVEEYDRNAWEEMARYLEYERAITI